ncbi:MAG TPA: hypothetical protein VFE18_14710 [Phenylobacterium sp.]|uniref:hypothetical protein n=1 Tax=Phenylobacterium sp. TaxID=1871053 RepID=UPI002D4D75E9|nr:hypothetical protein [Phenylobacterium sp.]HZZ69422.1 hypothetical protein [Phenylobacterium sp.]
MAAGLAAWSLLAGQSQAVALPNLHTVDKTALAVCATEREPLVELESEYTGVKRAKLTNAFASSAKAGLSMLLGSNPLFALASTAVKRAGMMNQEPGAHGNTDPDGTLAEALSLKIPGVDPPPPTAAGTSGNVSQLVRLVQPGQPVNDNSARTLLAISILAAIGGSTDVYIKVKQQQYSNDPQRISQAIEGDAGSQVPVSVQAAAQLKVLADCREKQVTDFNTKLAAASEKDRKALIKAQAGLRSAVTADFDLSNDLAMQQATVARVLTQGRAMAENKSEADMLNPQAPAYDGQASTSIWRLPPLETAAGMAPPPVAAPPPPPKVTYVAIRATQLRSAPDPKAKLVMNLAVGHSLIPTRRSPADISWWEVDLGGTPAYVPSADFAEPGSVPPPAPAKGARKGKGKGAPPLAAPPPPPPPPPPDNIRSLNGRVIEVRTDGAERLKALVDGLQVATS